MNIRIIWQCRHPTMATGWSTCVSCWTVWDGQVCICTRRILTSPPTFEGQASLVRLGSARVWAWNAWVWCLEHFDVSVFVCTMPMAWLAVVRCNAIHTCGSLGVECLATCAVYSWRWSQCSSLVEKLFWMGTFPCVWRKWQVPMLMYSVCPCLPPACYMWGVHISHAGHVCMLLSEVCDQLGACWLCFRFLVLNVGTSYIQCVFCLAYVAGHVIDSILHIPVIGLETMKVLCWFVCLLAPAWGPSRNALSWVVQYVPV